MRAKAPLPARYTTVNVRIPTHTAFYTAKSLRYQLSYAEKQHPPHGNTPNGDVPALHKSEMRWRIASILLHKPDVLRQIDIQQTR